MSSDDERSNTLGRLFLANRGKILGFLLSLGAGASAEDLLQEVWLRLERVDPTTVTQGLPYLYRVAHNAFLDDRRGARRTSTRDHAWSESRETVESAHDRTLIAREELRAVERALDALGEPAAGIFRRHRVAGISQRQIATDLGMGLSTIERHLRRAYAAIAALREDQGEG